MLDLRFANSDSALDAARQMYLNSQLKIVDHGYDNIVVLVDQTVALRFPRNDDAYIRDKYEMQLLSLIKDADVPAKLPYVIDEKDDPISFVVPFLDGEHMPLQTIRTVSPAMQRRIGEDIARFAFALHSSISIDTVTHLQNQLGIDNRTDETWEVTIRRYLNEYQFATKSQTDVAREYYRKWQSLDTTAAVVVHDDLHVDNLLFVGGRLNAVLDFGDATIGTAEQDLRHLYWINEFTLQSGAREYERLSGRLFNIDAAKTWAIVQELTAYGNRLSRGQTDHSSLVRARLHLNEWFAHSEW